MAGKYEREYGEEVPEIQETSKRGYWANRAEFLLASIGNVWGLTTWVRFPYICYKNGGLGVFIIPYAVMLCHLGLPLLFLEYYLGQYSSQGILNTWRIVPLFTGVGITLMLLISFTTVYTIVIQSWSVFYMFASFVLPWQRCDNLWNTASCYEAGKPTSGLSYLNRTTCDQLGFYVAYDGYCYNKNIRVAYYDFDALMSSQSRSAEEEYYNNVVVTQSMDLGPLDWKRSLCLLFCWVTIAVCLCVGVRSLGKVVYVTSTLPVLLILVLLIRAVTLPGADSGIQYLMLPSFARLIDMNLWLEAATEVLFSLGVGQGAYLTLASYNRFRNLFVFDAWFLIVVHIMINILVSVTVFAFFGFLSHTENVPLNEIASGGMELLFVAVPRALRSVPGTPGWCFIFFLAVFLTQLGPHLVMVETLITGLCDRFRILLSYRFVIVGLLCAVFFMLGLIFCIPVGLFILNSLDLHIMPFTVLLVICAVCTCLVLFYPICNVRHDVMLMFGGRNKAVLICTLLFFIPAILHWFLLPLSSLFFLIISAMQYQFPDSFPWWSQLVGFLTLGVTLLPLLLTPVILMVIACAKGCKMRGLVTPDRRWGPFLSRYRVKATHLPHINVSPPSAEGVPLNRMAPIASF